MSNSLVQFRHVVLLGVILAQTVCGDTSRQTVNSISPLNGPRREKTCLREFANNTGADQPAHPRSLISAFVIRFFESIICKLATGEISVFLLVSVAEETGLKLALAETPKTGFLAMRPIY